MGTAGRWPARICAAVVLVGLSGSAVRHVAADTPATVNVAPSQAATTPWLGLGLNWGAYDNGTSLPASVTNAGTPTPYNLSSQQWQATDRRLDFAAPGFMRIDIDSIWYCANPCGSNGFQYDFTTPMMQNLAATVDDTHRRGTPVLLGFFDANQWASPSLATDPGMARMVADAVNYLVNTRGDNNIRWFGGINELNDYSFTPDQVDTMLHNMRSALDARGLAGVAIAGPDTAQFGTPCTTGSDACLGWMQLHDPTGNYYPRTAQQSGHIGEVGLWDTHWYPSRAQIAADQVESELRSALADLSGYPTTAPLVLGEAGDYLSDAPDDAFDLNNVSGHRAEDGLAMADVGIQVARSGAAGAAMWCTDSVNYGFDCGMWNVANDPAPRQRFTSWALLSRFLPSGSTIYAVPGPGADVRLVVAETPSGGWTIAAVNRGTMAAPITLRFPAGQPGGPASSVLTASQQWAGYLSDPLHGPSAAVDNDHLPMPVSRTVASLDGGVPITVPPQALAVVTTLPGSAAAETALHLSATNQGGALADHSLRMAMSASVPLYGILPGDRVEYDVQLDHPVAGAGGIDIVATDGTRLSAAPEWSLGSDPAAPNLSGDGGGRVHQSILIPPSFDGKVAAQWQVAAGVTGDTTSYGASYFDVVVRNAAGVVTLVVYTGGGPPLTSLSTAGVSAHLSAVTGAVDHLGFEVDNDTSAAAMRSARISMAAPTYTIRAGDVVEYDVRLSALAAPRTGNVVVDDEVSALPPLSLCPAECVFALLQVSLPSVTTASLRAGGLDVVTTTGTSASADGAGDGSGALADPIGLFAQGTDVWLHRHAAIPAALVGQVVATLAVTGNDPTPGLRYDTLYDNVEITDAAGNVEQVLYSSGVPLVTAVSTTGSTASAFACGAPLTVFGT